MKKIALLGGALCLLAALPTNSQALELNTQVFQEYPRSSDWNRSDRNDRYWYQQRLNQEAREREEREYQLAMEEAREQERWENAYYKKHRKHSKKYWKTHSRYDESRNHDHNYHGNR